MPYTHQWHTEGRILVVRLWGEISVEDFQTASARTAELIAQGTSPVHILSDNSGVTRMPYSLRQLVDSAQSMRQPGMGWLIIIGPVNPALQFFGSMIAQILNVNFRAIASQEEALNFLIQRDPTLQPLTHPEKQHQ
jgi:hypothetical protein